MRLSCGIFLTLVLHFRRALKAEIGIFYPMVLLRVIEGAAGPAGVSQAQARRRGMGGMWHVGGMRVVL